MKTILSLFVVLLGLNVFSSYVSADIDVYEFSSEEKRERYLGLTKELRCPKCQNQDIADSNAPIAQDMRREVHRMVEEGKAHDDVVSFMIERFGDFVTYKPAVVPSTYLLWFGPFALIALGVFVVWRMSVKKKQIANASEAHGLDKKQRAKLDDLLAKYDDSEEHKEGDKP